MARRVKIALDLTLSQARTLRSALGEATVAYEDAHPDDKSAVREGRAFERLEAKLGPIIAAAICDAEGQP